MRLFLRTIAYSVGLLLVLGYGSYRLYTSPSQVKARLARSLALFLAAETRIEGCEQPFFGTLSVKRIEIPAAPIIAARQILELDEVTVEDTSARRPFRYRKFTEPQTAPPTVRARNAVLRLEHEIAGPAGGEKERWNFQDLLKVEALLGLLQGRHPQVLANRLEVHLREHRSPRQEIAFKIDARDAELRRAEPDGVVLEADLAEGEYWSSGQVEVSWSREGGAHLRAGADDVRGVERWLGLLSKDTGELWERFRPTGSLNVDIEDFHIAGDGKPSLRAIVRHYDTTAKLGALGLELRHLSGPMAVTESGARFGNLVAGEPASAEVLGVGVEVEGELGFREGELRLRLLSAPLEAILSSILAARSEKGGKPLGSLISLLRARGTIEGCLTLGFQREQGDRVLGSFRLKGAELAGIPVCSGLQADLRFDRDPAQGPGAAPGGKGKLSIEEAALAGLGSGLGEIRFDWNDRGMQVQFTDLKVSSTAPGVGVMEMAGSVLGSAGWGWEAGVTAVDMRWLGINVSTTLLGTCGSGGSFNKTSAEAPGTGVLEFAKSVTVPAGLLWPECESLLFRDGTCRVTADCEKGKRILLQSLQLTGEKQSLRATGEIGLSGSLDLVVFVDQGPTHSALGNLPDDSEPPDWKDAARGSYRAFRISGALAAPRVREIGALDPVFVRRK